MIHVFLKISIVLDALYFCFDFSFQTAHRNKNKLITLRLNWQPKILKQEALAKFTGSYKKNVYFDFKVQLPV